MMKHNEQNINPSPITIAILDLTLWKAQTPRFCAPSMICAKSLVWVAPCEIFLHCQISTTRLEFKVDQVFLGIKVDQVFLDVA
jgi:hypothetical protein